MACGTSVSELTINLLDDCLPNGQGLYEKLFAIRLGEIESVTKDGTGKIATAIILKAGKTFKRWEGRKLSHKRTTGFTSSDSGNLLPQGFDFTVNTNSAAADKEVDSMSKLTDLVIISKQTGANGRWKMSGYPTGMACTNVTEDSNDAENPGQYKLSFLAALARETALTFRHVTSSVEDTEAYLENLSLAIS
ncbi:hypothetical protein [Spirosoma luteum]|uniref:hypothetical protein n=1 Tax=Spirosoma luteum TaxID=431553 RepID=UPI0003791C38|nr:hypothetical protein [Spirosoma luteum]